MKFGYSAYAYGESWDEYRVLRRFGKKNLYAGLKIHMLMIYIIEYLVKVWL